MAHFHSNEKIMVPLRGVAALFTIIELGLSAYAVSVWDANITFDDGFGFYTEHFNFGTINFLLFASLWTLLVLVYLLVAWRARKFSHIYATLALLAVTMIFWFAGFIAAAVLVGTLVQGCVGGICSATDAAVAFAAFLWVIFLVDTIFVALAVFRGTSHGGVTNNQPGMAAA